MKTLANEDMKIMIGGSAPQSYETLAGSTFSSDPETGEETCDIDESTAGPDDVV